MTKEMESIKQLFTQLGRNEKIDLLQTSSLKDREIQLITLRLVQGKSLKECSNLLGIEEDSINKAQLKAVKKLYNWIILFSAR